jgi:hypothetical protein
MNRESQIETEVQTLRALCDESTPCEERQRLLQSLNRDNFTEPEHQIVFESIRALLSRGPISVAKLLVHLNNRGFPDTDVGKYFRPAATGSDHRDGAGNGKQ